MKEKRLSRFSQFFQEPFTCSAIIFVNWLDESRETSESEPSSFPVTNIPLKPQAAMPSSFNTEVRPISPPASSALPEFDRISASNNSQ